MTDPDGVADVERVGPRYEKLTLLAWTNSRPVATLPKAGKIGSDRRPSVFEERAREVDEVLTRHAEAMEKDDIASATRFAMRDAGGHAREMPRESLIRSRSAGPPSPSGRGH